jgi:hypothetical protein
MPNPTRKTGFYENDSTWISCEKPAQDNTMNKQPDGNLSKNQTIPYETF